MKKATSLAAAMMLIIGGTSHAQGQTVTLGGVTFGADSNQARSDSYCPMQPEIVQKFLGFGDYTGLNKTHKYSRGESVLGVSTVNCAERGASELPGLVAVAEPTGELTTTGDDSVLALDTAGNVRLLKKIVNGSVVFEASSEVAPPILFPAAPAAGTSWVVLGKKVTVVSTDASIGAFQNLLKLKFEPTDDPASGAPAATTAPVENRYYRAGVGLVVIESTLSTATAGSGWEVQQQ